MAIRALKTWHAQDDGTYRIIFSDTGTKAYIGGRYIEGTIEINGALHILTWEGGIFRNEIWELTGIISVSAIPLHPK